MPEVLPHLLVVGYTESQDFKSTLSGARQQPPARPRAKHGKALLAQLAALAVAESELKEMRAALELPVAAGMTIALEISPAGALDYFRQLEWKRDGIEILSAIEAGGTEIVTLHVPEGKLTAFQKRVQEYLQKDVKSRKEGGPFKPAHAALVNAISAFRKAAFNELWTDAVEPPEPNEVHWFQAWLRLKGQTSNEIRDEFAESAAKFGIEVEPGFVSFPGRVVVAVRGTRASLEDALELLDVVAEVRSVTPTAEFYLADLKPYQQVEWIKDLEKRSKYATDTEPAFIALLDTGVNQGHALLAPILDSADLHAVDVNWGVSDHAGHGTEMAGIAGYGDLTRPLSSTQPNIVPHRLESVKIWPPKGQNSPHLYGVIVSEAARRVETAQAGRRRTYAMMTTSEGPTSGMPSEWSASIDRLAFGLDAPAVGEADTYSSDEDTQPLAPRLFVLAAGNVPWPRWSNYPAENATATIENPGQAWNAITVGACTSLTTIDTAKWPSLSILAGSGGMSPSSTTSMIWPRRWPFKPDVVAEGGNASLDNNKASTVLVGPDSLRVLTTSHDVTKTPLTESGDTSAAAAEVARICAHLSTRYPDYWPETIRALVIHGAGYTAAMRNELPLVHLKRDKENLLRRYGYGRAEFDTALNSTFSRPTLVLQEWITPYAKADGTIKLGKLNMHALPWPLEQLQDMGGASVAMRVTLSYFVQPNPSARGWQSKFRYQSHGLRFAVKGSTETEARFEQRINQLQRDELGADGQESMSDPDANFWFLGSQLRLRGSVHSDLWMGTAAQLAAKSHIAVFPVGGWWKDWSESQGHSRQVRYALAVTLEVHEELEVPVDLYSPIANKIGVPVVIAGA